jgi:hypothetical protein
MALADNISVSKTRLTRKTRGAMKVQFNLTKEEAEAFSNFFNAVNVNGLSETDFTKSAFIIGLQAMESSIMAEMKRRLEAEGGDVEIVEDENEDETTEE